MVGRMRPGRSVRQRVATTWRNSLGLAVGFFPNRLTDLVYAGVARYNLPRNNLYQQSIRRTDLTLFDTSE